VVKAVAGLVVFAALLFGSRWLRSAFALPRTWTLLFGFCAVVGWLQSQRSLRAVALQRIVRVDRIALIELLEILVGNAILTAVAYLTRSPWCFAASLAGRMLFGAILLSPSYTRMRKDAASAAPLQSAAAELQPLLRHGIPLQAVNLLGMANGLATAVIVTRIASTSVLGVVQWANSVAAVPFSILPPFYAFLFALFASRYRLGTGNSEAAIVCSQAATAVCAFGGSVLLACYEPLVGALFTSKWLGAERIVALLIAANVIGVPLSILGSYLSSSGHCRAWLATNIVGTGGIVAIAPALTRYLGGVGYALGWATATAISILWLTFMFRRLLRVRLSAMPFLGYTGMMLASAYVGRSCGGVTDVFLLDVLLRSVATAACFASGAALLHTTAMRTEWPTLRCNAVSAVSGFRSSFSARRLFAFASRGGGV
jgi:O-antigen/teichoic acid export membrane protein